MIAKIVMTGLGMALSYVLVNKLQQARVRARARAAADNAPPPVSRLRQDPETGIYYPEK